MPKAKTFPDRYDRMNRINISDLKKLKLTEGSMRVGVMSWSRGDVKAGSAAIRVNMLDEYDPYIELDYMVGGEHVNYRIRLVSTPSNLGSGRVWYFLCPATGKRCRTLYLNKGYFYHRTAFPNAMYQIQTESKKDRPFSALGEANRAKESFFAAKHVRTHYRGKPTKRYTRLLNKVDRRRKYEEKVIQILRKETAALQSRYRSIFDR